MKIITENISINTKGNCDITDITPFVAALIEKNKIRDGSANIFVIGSTASVSTTEFEPGLKKDIPQILDKLIPSKEHYNHNETWGDHNGHAHIRATLVGCSKTIPFVNGELLLGTWQQIILIDFDERPRVRKIVIQLMGE